MKPLDGVRILDFTRFQNGPHATVMLGDLGAEVLKVEQPLLGDPGRSLGRQPDGFCAYFEAYNRGKKSISLDIRKPHGQQIVMRLLQDYDVVTENFRAGYMDSIGLGYEALKRAQPNLIYAASTGFGLNGPWASAVSYDLVAQGFSGLMAMQGSSTGGRPEAVALAIADQVGSFIFAFAIQAAILHRLRTGVGQRVDASLIGAQAAMLSSLFVRFLKVGDDPSARPRKNSVPGAIFGIGPAYSWYQASDGLWFTVAMADAKTWPQLCEIADRTDLLEDERCSTPFLRKTNEEWLYAELALVFATQPRGYWLGRLREKEVPGGPLHTIGEAAADEQLWANGYLQKQPHPHFGELGIVGVPYRLSESPATPGGAAPELGANTEEILLELGFTWAELEELRTNGVI